MKKQAMWVSFELHNFYSSHNSTITRSAQVAAGAFAPVSALPTSWGPDVRQFGKIQMAPIRNARQTDFPAQRAYNCKPAPILTHPRQLS